jgi:hypothetical protein
MARRIARLVTGSFALSAALLAGCGGQDAGSPTAARADSEPIRVVVTPAAPSMLVGERVQLTAVAYTRRGIPVPNVEFVWLSSDMSVATVDPGGVVTSQGFGWAGVQARAKTVAGYSRIAVGAD